MQPKRPSKAVTLCAAVLFAACGQIGGRQAKQTLKDWKSPYSTAAEAEIGPIRKDFAMNCVNRTGDLHKLTAARKKAAADHGEPDRERWYCPPDADGYRSFEPRIIPSDMLGNY